MLGLGCCLLVVARAGAGRGARAEGVKRASLVTRLAVRGRGRFRITIEVNSDKLNVVSYRLTKVASLVQLDIRLGDTK